MKISIVPEIINSKKIVFLDEKDIEVTICKNSIFKYISPFQKPFLIIDTFAKKTIKPEEIINIEIDELKTRGFMVTTIKAGRRRWFAGQRTIYRIESISNPTPGSKKINYIPTNHKIQRDVINDRVRIIGPNAGYPRRGNGGPWITLETK